MTSELSQKINSLKVDISIQENYLYRLEKLIGDPDTDQKKLRKTIATSKRELKQMNDKHNKLVNQWAETEYKQRQENPANENR